MGCCLFSKGCAFSYRRESPRDEQGKKTGLPSIEPRKTSPDPAKVWHRFSSENLILAKPIWARYCPGQDDDYTTTTYGDDCRYKLEASQHGPAEKRDP